MKVSIITACYNSASTIKGTIESVINQTYNNIEFIIIDGASKDGTVDIVSSYGEKISKFISEPDKGIYNAMNKGIRIATGDIVGILNSDDFFNSTEVIQKIVDEFNKSDIDALYGDVQFVKPNDLQKVVRYYSSKNFNPKKFKYGFMPAHPSFYVKRTFFEKIGYYKETYIIGADYELLIRFLHNNKLKSKYLQMPFVTMRTGGVSNRSLKSNLILNNEIIRACGENGIKTNIINVYSKYFIKIFELFSIKQ
ncbi:MAG: glycosyltransferase [Bacteroidales bacterium]|nr:MAG: glycosyltransferase [Bacteroidales bacterium]